MPIIPQLRHDLFLNSTQDDGCRHRLCQADIHNFMAQLALDDGDRDKAKEHAEIAKERAWCDGPPHYYKPAYEEAERLLKAAGGK